MTETTSYKDLVIPMPPKPPKFGSLQVKADSKTPYSDATLCKKGGRVKRPMNAFMVWSREERRKIVEIDPDMDNALISMMLGKRWKTLSNMQRLPYVEEAERLKQLHLLENPGYKYIPRKKQPGAKPGRQPKKNTTTAEDKTEGKRKSSTGSTSSSDSCSSILLSTGQPDTSCIEVKHRKISDPTPCRSLSSPDESLEETYIAPVTSVDYHCYLPSTEPYPQELDHYIVIEDPAEAFSIVSEPYSHEWKSKSETSPKSASQYWPSSTNANLTMPTYDWSSGNDYRDTVCRSLDSESVYSSINSTVSDYDYELPEPVPVAEEIEIETSSPHSPQPPKLETVKTLDMILEDIMNSPVVVGCEQATQTEDGLPSISTLMARWQT